MILLEFIYVSRTLSLCAYRTLFNIHVFHDQRLRGHGMADFFKADQISEEGDKKQAKRNLGEPILKEPIRYKHGDAIEAWLVGLLRLDYLGQNHTITEGTCP